MKEKGWLVKCFDKLLCFRILLLNLEQTCDITNLNGISPGLNYL